MLLTSSAYAGEVKDWMRHPLTTVPYLDRAPTIDGTVDRAEWQAAGILGPLLLLPEGVSGELDQRVWIGYDGEYLYIAFDIERPKQVREPSAPNRTGRIDNWGVGDSVELMLDIAHEHKQYYAFNLYPNGVYSDGIGRPGLDKSWNRNWHQAARMTDRGWQGEVAIPFRKLGLDGAPEPGAVWGFDFVDNQRTPFKQIGLFAFRGSNWHKLENMGHLRFGAHTEPAVRFMQAREAGGGKVVVEFDVVNDNREARAVDARIILMRRKEGTAGGPKSYYEHIESGGDDAYNADEVDFEKTTTLRGLIKEAINFYAPLEGAFIQQVVEVPINQRRTVGFVRSAGPGEFLVLYEFQCADGEPLAAGAKVFRIAPSLPLTLEPYWLHAEQLNAIADLRKVQLPEGAKLIFSIHPSEGSNEVLAQAETSVFVKSVKGQAVLPTAKLDPGFYQVQARLVTAEGTEIARNYQAVEKPPKPLWHNNKYGKRLKVPEPWTPLKANDKGIVEVWGRTYDLSTLLPRQIISQGEPLLASPVTLALAQERRPLKWRVTSLRLEEVDEAHAVYRGTLENSVAVLSGTVTIEFDGFAWYDLKLMPKGTLVQVDRMALAIDFMSKHAELMDMHKFLHDPIISREPIVPAKQGPSGILAESLLPFTPHLWIGDEDAGLAWIAEAPIDWHITEPDRVLEVQPANSGGSIPAQLRIHMIQAPTVIKDNMRIVFGLQASPARPMPPLGSTHIVQAGGPVVDKDWYRNLHEHGAGGVIFHSGWKGSPKSKYWGGWPERPPQPEYREGLKQAVYYAHRYNLPVSLYTGWGVATDSSEWKDFRYEMTRQPLENSGFGTYRQSAGFPGIYNDYMAWAIAGLIKEYDIDGVFYDSTSNLSEDKNIYISNGWIDKHGRVRPGFAIRGTRDLFKRIYTLVHGELKSGGQIVNFGGSLWCINIYADVFHRGEGTPMHVQHLRDAWKPLEIYRASYDGRKYGLASLAMNKNFKGLEMTVNTHHTITLLHGWHAKSMGYLAEKWAAKRMGYGREDQPMHKIWQARFWLPLDSGAKWYTFYKDGPKYISLEPASLISSAFVSSDRKRILLVVSNVDKKKIKRAKVKLDLLGLGLEGDAPVQAEDAILYESVPIREDMIILDILPERFRLIKLWRDK